MATNITLNGVTYSIPSTNETGWGDNVSTYLIALSTGVLTKAGGTFALTNEVDFGANYGIKLVYIKSKAANIASAGFIRMANGEYIAFRNAANDGDLQLKPKVGDDNIITFNGIELANLSSIQTLTNKTISGATNTISNVPDSALSSNVPKKDTANTFTQTQTFTDIDANFIDMSNALADPSYLQGRLFWDSTEKALSYYNDVNGVKCNLGHENYVRVLNDTGSLIPDGSLVYISGAQADRPKISLAKADAALTAETVIGMVTHDIANGDVGYATTFGLVHNINTSGINAGEQVYLSATTAGAYTNVRPSAPNFVICIGICTRSSAGVGHIFVSPKELQDKIRSIVEGGTGANTALGARQNLGCQPAFNGIEDASAIVATYDSTARTFTVTATNAYVWCNGVRYLKNGVETTAAHANTSGKWFLYYDSSGNLTVSSTAWDITTTAQVMMVNYRATGTKCVLAINEKHKALDGMGNFEHYYNHTTRGTQVISGFAASGYTLSTSTNNTAASPNALDYAIASGVILDEDIVTNCSQLAEVTTKRIYYKVGAAGEWDYSEVNSNGILNVGGDIAYNQFTGGAWQQTAAGANNRWVNYFIGAVQQVDPLTGSASNQIVVIQGQTLHTSLASAQGESPSSLSGLTDLTGEFAFLYRVTYRRMTATNSQIDSFDFVTANLVTISNSFSPTSHSALTNRSDANSHPASAISTDTTNFNDRLSSADDTVQKALDTLDGHVHSHTTLTDIGTNTHAQIDTHIGASSAHGVSGSIVGTSDSQILTNKTIDTTLNTVKATGITAGYVLAANGSDGTSWQAQSTSPDSPMTINNLGLACSVGSNALTIALKGKDGNDPSAGNKVSVALRNPTLTNGTYNVRDITSALSLVISSGSTLGHTSSKYGEIFVYLIDSDGSGTMKLGVSSILLDESTLHTSVAEGGAGGADSKTTLYSDAAYSGKPIRLIARLLSKQSSVGVWAAVPENINLASELSLYNRRKVYVEGVGNDADVITTEVTNVKFVETVDLDNCFDSRIFTAKIEDMYAVSGGIRVSSAASLAVYYYVNGFKKKGICQDLDASKRFYNFSFLVYLEESDQLSIRMDGATLVNDATFHNITISRLGY